MRNKINSTLIYKNELRSFNNISNEEFVDSIKSIKRDFLKNADKKFLDENNKKVNAVEVARDFVYLKSLCDSSLNLKSMIVFNSPSIL